MKKLLIIPLLLLSAVFRTSAQYHDHAVFEAYQNNNLAMAGFRGGVLLFLEKEKAYADSIYQSISRRLHVEEMNILDRQAAVTDLAYVHEKDKLEKCLDQFLATVEQITVNGGSPSDYRSWKLEYQALCASVRGVRDAYLPLSRRKEMYLEIEKRARKKLSEVTGYVVMLRQQRQVAVIKDSYPSLRKRPLDSVLTVCRQRFRVAYLSAVNH